MTDPPGQLHAVGKLIGALAFGWALVFIYYTTVSYTHLTLPTTSIV